MANVTIHIKNMAGEILPLALPSSSTVEGVAQRLTAMDRMMYPPYRTKVLRLAEEHQEEDQKGDEEQKSVPLQEDEMLAVFVTSDVTTETGVFPDEPNLLSYRGKPYTRFLFPLRELLPDYKGEDFLYVYPLYETTPRGTTQPVFDVSLSPCPMDERYPWNRCCVLSKCVRASLPNITPDAMKYIQDTIDAYYEQLRSESDIHCVQFYDSKEVVVCDCGSRILRSGLTAHRKTKKHIKATGC